MNRLLGKVVLVTEAQSSIGAATARLASNNGAIVVCTGKSLDKLATIVSEITQKGGTAVSFEHDISSFKSWQKVIARTIKKYAKIDVLVNNAGISSPKILLELSAEDWYKIQTIDLNSFTYVLKEVLPIMKKNGGGSIVTVSSLQGLVGLPESSPYVAAKDVLRSQTLDAAFEYAKDNIRINSICPGVIHTPLIETSFPNIKPLYKKFVQFPYLGKPEDIANGIIYLACDEASFVTGAEIVIHGDRITK
ncbi:SDR family oxidoreductase [Enterococcus ureilyticus]|uniref:SDR family oxidoreductase n=1 Tax=Enterococcus ureilyticus TaxID=1131292 RepID=A0A1E5H9S5_9ENTE|nr:SDR family NAD(P)-dependent oxidoreductase [Enterococcus ureilyticus]MBM7688571.1 NAD(P)-dependent dehydrogenase (short-subunit alcohol dehydrogenase family) [Enterococcus ureilyticus]OEG21664.1 SDR family oxidoreductase [Enterococcus ureilyticus]